MAPPSFFGVLPTGHGYTPGMPQMLQGEPVTVVLKSVTCTNFVLADDGGFVEMDVEMDGGAVWVADEGGELEPWGVINDDVAGCSVQMFLSNLDAGAVTQIELWVAGRTLINSVGTSKRLGLSDGVTPLVLRVKPAG